MAFFGNDAINRVNLHYAVASIAGAAGGAFVLAYFLHAGVSVPLTLCAMTGILIGRFLFRPAILPLGIRFGLKPLLIFGVLSEGAVYPLLAFIHGLNWALIAYCVLSSIAATFYWTCYHAYFASLGDEEHRGHQIGAREAVAAIVGIVAPLAGAWGLVTVGPVITFTLVGVVQAAAAIPLFGAPNVSVPKSAPGAARAARFGVAIFLNDGWLGGTYYYVFQVALFVTLSRSIAAYGGVLALTALLSAGISAFLGRHIDRGHGQRAVVLAFVVTAAVLALRAASVGNPWLAVLANAAGAFVVALFVPVEMTAIYNVAKASPDPLRFHIATEGAWDVGGALGCVVGAAMAWNGVSLSYAILLGLVSCLVSGTLLWRYYGAHPAAGGVDVEPRAADPFAPP
ncbi:MAG TPA: MFS transporter [Caulobacteraceae bacterium]|jgi:MFS family permease